MSSQRIQWRSGARRRCARKATSVWNEALERRMLLSAGAKTPDELAPSFDPQTILVPHPTPRQTARVRRLAAEVTTSGSSAPLYLPVGQLTTPVITPATGESRSLIHWTDFRADPRFAEIIGSGFSIAVLDTGIDRDHPFFGPDADGDGTCDRIVAQYDFADSDPDASDVNSHGSNVASIAASQDDMYGGMAPQAGIVALKVFSDSGAGTFGWLEAALQWAIAHAAEFNIAAINMSLSDRGNYDVPSAKYGVDDELAVLSAMNVMVVSAAGNDYFQYQAPGVGYPAADANSLAVGAVWDSDCGGPFGWSTGAVDYSTESDRVISFSQRSATQSDVFAPGGLITGASATGTTVTFAGTSQATPHIAGVAVLAQQLAVRELGRRLAQAEFSSLLRSSGVMITDGDDEDDNVYNLGVEFARVDVLALAEAIAALAGPDTSGPRVWRHDPGDTVVPGQSTLDFHFDEPMDPSSFSLADVASFTGPGEVDLRTQLVGFAWLDDNTLQVQFMPQNVPGSYSIVIGPDITDDAPSFNPMNQNNNATAGEVPDDCYTASFSIIPAAYVADMNSDPGWTISGGQWAYGHPTGRGGGLHGYPDPSNGFTGSNVIGVNLGGNYSVAVGGPYYVTTPPINCSDYTGVTLSFMRWLNTDCNEYVGATIDVSSDGTTWTSVYRNPEIDEVADNTWQSINYDISAVADSQPAVYLRWGYQVRFSAAFPYSGWNIDDVVVSGTLLPPSGFIEGRVFQDNNGDGAVDAGEAGLADVTLWLDADNDAVVDPGEATAVTNGAGEYRFDELPDDTYHVRQLLPPHFARTTAEELTVTIDGGIGVSGQDVGAFRLWFSGSGDSDSYEVALIDGGASLRILETLGTGPAVIYTIVAALVSGSEFVISAGKGNDLVQIDVLGMTGGATFVLDGGAGDDQLSARTPAGLAVSATSLAESCAAPTIATFAQMESLNLGGHDGWITGDLGPSDVVLNFAAACILSDQHVRRLELGAGQFDLGQTGDGVMLCCSELAVSESACAHLHAAGGLMIDYDISSPLGTWDGSAYTGVTGLLQCSRLFADPLGPGGATMTLAIAEASHALEIGGTQTGIWKGHTVDATSVLVRDTYVGDADLDGDLDGDDYFRIDSHVARSGSVFGWQLGDFNYDGEIDGNDYFLIDSNLAAAQAAGQL